MSKLRILLADDHETLREGLKTILNAQPDMKVVGEAVDGQSTLEQAKELRPDLIVLDVSMPRMNGLKAMEALRDWDPKVKVVTLTRHAGQGYLQQLLRAGASGYVLKQSRSHELLTAIRAIAAGGKYLDPAVAGEVIESYGRGLPRSRADQPAALSRREEEVLRLVAWGYSNKEIAARLSLSVKTVETHKMNASQKLGLQNRIDIVRYAVLEGWLQDL